MKLLFKKNEENEISVFQDIDGKEREFEYVHMIKALLKSKKLEKSEISKGFTDAEIISINRMVELINKQVDDTEKSKSAQAEA